MATMNPCLFLRSILLLPIDQGRFGGSGHLREKASLWLEKYVGSRSEARSARRDDEDEIAQARSARSSKVGQRLCKGSSAAKAYGCVRDRTRARKMQKSDAYRRKIKRHLYPVFS